MATTRTSSSRRTRAPPPSPTIANAISAEYGFWLGDAFASGGSAGYDHKAMGITARGAWESVKRHFREMGVDTQTDRFQRRRHRRHVGRRLRQRHAAVEAHPPRRRVRSPARLHRSEPRRRASFAERKRLFELPRSSWADYDTKLDLAGRRRVAAQREVDSAFTRSAARSGSRPRRRRPGGADQRDPRAPVDLLWNGGIGTYVKSADGDARRRRRPCERRDPRQRQGAALQGRGRGRQPRPHPARAASSCACNGGRSTRISSTTRPASTARITRSTSRSCSDGVVADGELTGEAAQHAARADDRRGRRARAARQLLPDPVAVDRRPRCAGPARRAASLHPVSGEGRPAQPRARVPAFGRGDRRAARG